jgi:hypothetical protein
MEIEEQINTAVALPRSVATSLTSAKGRVPSASSRRFQFDSTKKLSGEFKKHVRALSSMEPSYNHIFDNLSYNNPDSYNIFEALWPGIPFDEAAPTSETRIALGVVGFLAHLATQSPRVRTLLDNAPDRPNQEFHIVNALLATIRHTAKPVTDLKVSTFLLKKTLQFLVSHTSFIPGDGIGKPDPTTVPFPLFSLFTHSFIDLMGCTPRLTVDYKCTEHDDGDDSHKFGYRLQGHFLDALRISPDETATLAEILEEFENELMQGDSDVQSTCNRDHPMHIHSYYYGDERAPGPPPLLFFEATRKDGIAHSSITEQVSLGGFSYHLVSLVRLELMGGCEHDLVLELEIGEQSDTQLGAASSCPVALVVYVRDATMEDLKILNEISLDADDDYDDDDYDYEDDDDADDVVDSIDE